MNVTWDRDGGRWLPTASSSSCCVAYPGESTLYGAPVVSDATAAMGGDARVWYHGSSHGGITELRPSKGGMLGPGVYLASFDKALRYAAYSQSSSSPCLHWVHSNGAFCPYGEKCLFEHLPGGANTHRGHARHSKGYIYRVLVHHKNVCNPTLRKTQAHMCSCKSCRLALSTRPLEDCTVLRRVVDHQGRWKEWGFTSYAVPPTKLPSGKWVTRNHECVIDPCKEEYTILDCMEVHPGEWDMPLVYHYDSMQEWKAKQWRDRVSRGGTFTKRRSNK